MDQKQKYVCFEQCDQIWPFLINLLANVAQIFCNFLGLFEILHFLRKHCLCNILGNYLGKILKDWATFNCNSWSHWFCVEEKISSATTQSRENVSLGNKKVFSIDTRNCPFEVALTCLIKFRYLGREPCSSGYGRRLMSKGRGFKSQHCKRL